MKKAKKIWKLSKKSLVILMNKLGPRIRFEGFIKEWEIKKLETLVDVYDGIHSTPTYINKGIMFLSVEDIKTLNSNKYISEEEFDKKFKQYPVYGDVLMTRIGSVGKSNIVKSKEKIAYYVSLALLKPKNIYNLFLNSSINSYYMQKRIWEKTLHVAFPKKINKNEIGKLNIGICQKEEQEKIGAFFEKLDRLIESQESYLELNKKLKKSLLQKLFPKEGEDRPQLRFPGFNNKWEIKKLGNLCKVVTGKLDANAMEENGVYDFYTSGIQKFKINKYAFEGPSITIAGNGATVGYMHLADGKFNAYQRTYVLSNFISDRYFTYYSITKNLPKKIHEESRAGNIPYIVMDMLTELKLMSPTLKEQEKIGSLFKSLDEKIESEEKKLRAYKDFKKSMLQKMFV